MSVIGSYPDPVNTFTGTSLKLKLAKTFCQPGLDQRLLTFVEVDARDLLDLSRDLGQLGVC